MKVRSIYPKPKKESFFWLNVIKACAILFPMASIVCTVVNLAVGGKAWCFVVAWSLWSLWTCAVSPALVEYNRMSQFIRAMVHICVLLILIDRLLAPGWAIKVVPIVCFSTLLVAGILFFTDITRQKQNMMPLLMLIAAAVVCSVAALVIWRWETYWALIVMGSFALSLLIGCIFFLGKGFFTELKKRFHVK